MTRATILAEVSAERDRQDDLWGGVEHDDRHEPADWLVIICRHVGLAAYDGSPDDACHKTEKTGRYDPTRYRREMVRVAAVAVAALEVFDRKAPPEPEPAAHPATPQSPWGQSLADFWGEPVLIMDHDGPTATGSPARPASIVYAVLWSQADAWQRENFVKKLEPKERAEAVARVEPGARAGGSV